MSQLRLLTRDEVNKIDDKPGVLVLYKNELAIFVEAESGGLRKRLLHHIDHREATSFSVEGLELESHRDREERADNLRKRFGLAKPERKPIGFSRTA
jgi:hypothetical protein